MHNSNLKVSLQKLIPGAKLTSFYPILGFACQIKSYRSCVLCIPALSNIIIDRSVKNDYSEKNGLA